MRRRDIAGEARYLTFSCYRRLRLFDNDRIKDRFVHHLATALSGEPDLALLAWVIMPEHAHLIVFPHADRPLTPFLSALKRPLAREVLVRWRTLNAPILARLVGNDGQTRFWQPGGGYDRNLLDTELAEKICYVHRNPIARRLVSSPTDWPWSSARAYAAHPDATGPAIAFDLLDGVKEDLL
jgi:putative transposase